ncbi:hypothetical protein AVEN_182295-1 [Araneus ventricosus]|uniref:Uncharacterized protein n=1 Tax=Araneus ventricosus TaxID=182803 RepID=A0A4Y1ZZ05_ARAVE|nr:hypothetical protein AVEN_192436-1 [Araneus ventricosus]GBL72604.1 hypothetical protein AVEN_244995-1 [Araneus ventricosus]GBL72703.1 hypothetical protein AVEN_174865-1 [Araneus ventricosus]GBL72711.1 hypothetical protein AVEN_182295-1 [Araneus ventricosus]
MLGYPLCTNFAITKLFVDYVMQSSFAYRQFNRNFTCGDPTILPYGLVHSRNRGSVNHKLRLPRAWQVLDVYASRLITLMPPEYGAPCETLLSVHLIHPAINCEACSPSARGNWITALCADLEESIMHQTAETTLQK